MATFHFPPHFLYIALPPALDIVTSVHTTVHYYTLLYAGPVIPGLLYYPAPCRIQLPYPLDAVSTSEVEVIPAPVVRCWCFCVGWVDGLHRAVNPGGSRLQQRSTSGAIDC